MWCAPASLGSEECSPPVTDFKAVQDKAQMSAIAVPLWYAYGKDHKDANKYCVITNWWKIRTQNGLYSHPRLDPSHYNAEACVSFPMEATVPSTREEDESTMFSRDI